MTKHRLLQIAKQSRAFEVARFLTAHHARIVCYHGLSTHDEVSFKPKMFMRPETFNARLELIERLGFEVVTLGELFQLQRAGERISDRLALTFDDGWMGFYKHAWPELQKRGWPCTLYVTTYCVDKRLRVMNNAVQYLLWASNLNEVDLRDWSEGRLGIVRKREGAFLLHDEDAISGDIELSPSSIRELRLNKLAELLDISSSHWNIEMFRLCEAEQLKEMAQAGVDLQLHTHRHRLGSDAEEIRREIEDNRRVLATLSAGPFEHFCYPSGEYHPDQFPKLAAVGIRTATTTEIGLVSQDANPLALPRLLDGENVTQLEFEAELSGFSHLARRALGKSRSEHI